MKTCEMMPLNRIWVIVLFFVYMAAICIASLCLLPYWIITGKIAYESKLFKAFEKYYKRIENRAALSHTIEGLIKKL